MSKVETESKKDFKNNIQLIPLQIELAKPFVDFIEDYRKFFGSELSTEQICMNMIYSQVKRLFNDFDSYTRQKNRLSFLNEGDFFKKYHYLGIVSWEAPEDEETE